MFNFLSIRHQTVVSVALMQEIQGSVPLVYKGNGCKLKHTGSRRNIGNVPKHVLNVKNVFLVINNSFVAILWMSTWHTKRRSSTEKKEVPKKPNSYRPSMMKKRPFPLLSHRHLASSHFISGYAAQCTRTGQNTTNIF
ncbi:hypothetical protein T4C_10866, partial [Trichinella pseudospiralis]